MKEGAGSNSGKDVINSVVTWARLPARVWPVGLVYAGFCCFVTSNLSITY